MTRVATIELAPAAPAPAPLRAAGGRLVLLVDHDPRTARRLARMLREDGFDVEEAWDGARAIARLSRAPYPDAVVTELRVSYADGAAISRYARLQRPGIPVFVMTGYPNLLVAANFGSPEPVVFTKPVDYLELRDRLAAALPSPECDTVGVEQCR